MASFCMHCWIPIGSTHISQLHCPQHSRTTRIFLYSRAILNKKERKLVDKHSSFHQLCGTILSMLYDAGIPHFFKASCESSPVTHSGNSLIKSSLYQPVTLSFPLPQLPHLSFSLSSPKAQVLDSGIAFGWYQIKQPSQAQQGQKVTCDLLTPNLLCFSYFLNSVSEK